MDILLISHIHLCLRELFGHTIQSQKN